MLKMPLEGQGKISTYTFKGKLNVTSQLHLLQNKQCLLCICLSSVLSLYSLIVNIQLLTSHRLVVHLAFAVKWTIDNFCCFHLVRSFSPGDNLNFYIYISLTSRKRFPLAGISFIPFQITLKGFYFFTVVTIGKELHGMQNQQEIMGVNVIRS